MNVLKRLQPFLASHQYALKFAQSASDMRLAQALRFEVFNLELNEGLDASTALQLDVDPFDEVCDHLLVEDLQTHRVVGTYRMQSGNSANDKLGYYCSQEFDLQMLEPFREETVELGRACIARDHRNFQVLSALWRGIATYAMDRGARYLIGCSSLTSQNPAEGVATYASMQGHLAPPAFRTLPHPNYACFASSTPLVPTKVPKLLSAYLSLGAWICGPPALDREFKTIDFLTLMDLQSDAMQLRRKRFGIST